MATIWSTARRSPTRSTQRGDHRNAFEHDYDRLLFSTPVRRLADKTQVFPLDKSDAVRTRLTHSHEVANLAKSLGYRLKKRGFSFGRSINIQEVAAILSTIGLAHDLGNPPFGHQGEAAIGNWFKQNLKVLSADDSGSGGVDEHLHPEFIEFEGNAQAFRILTHLQVSLGDFGLDLTAGTLAALMKYPTPCDKRDEDIANRKKYGYFESENATVEWVRAETGIIEGQRHPLTWIMEAADDIAYAVLDIEDAMHKGIISPDDIYAIVDHSLDNHYASTKKYISDKFKSTRSSKKSIKEIREIMSSYLRTAFIDALMSEAVDDYLLFKDDIMALSHDKPLMHGSMLLKCLKDTAKKYVFTDSSIRKIEADGFQIVGNLMDFYWQAIINRKSISELDSRRVNAKAAYGISKLSDNYLQAVNRAQYLDRNSRPLSIRYKELRLLTDMVSGMTDGFAKYEYDFLLENRFI